MLRSLLALFPCAFFLTIGACSGASSEAPNADPTPSDEGAQPPGQTSRSPGPKEDSPSRSPSPSGGVAKCETDLEPELERLKVPGVSVGIVKNGKLVCTGVAGMANIEEKRPVTPDTLFAWASVSKT